MAAFSVFGQELYFDESLRAIESFGDTPEDRHLSTQIAEQLPHPSATTRRRIASKIVQRFFKSSDGKYDTASFLKHVNHLKSESDRLDLLYWRTARTDNIIAAIAREIFYPYFVLHALPDRYDEARFHSTNTSTLFELDRIITRDFAIDYAKNIWNFNSARTVALALRIMKQAKILDAVSVKLRRRHVLGYYLRPHTLSPDVFAYCMYEEFQMDRSTTDISLDRIQNADCVKLFFLNTLQVGSLLKSLERKKAIGPSSRTSGRHIRLTSANPGSLVDSLLGE